MKCCKRAGARSHSICTARPTRDASLARYADAARCLRTVPKRGQKTTALPRNHPRDGDANLPRKNFCRTISKTASSTCLPAESCYSRQEKGVHCFLVNNLPNSPVYSMKSQPLHPVYWTLRNSTALIAKRWTFLAAGMGRPPVGIVTRGQ